MRREVTRIKKKKKHQEIHPAKEDTILAFPEEEERGSWTGLPRKWEAQ